LVTAAGAATLVLALVPWPLSVELRGELAPGRRPRLTVRLAAWGKWIRAVSFPAARPRRPVPSRGPLVRFLARALALPRATPDRVRVLAAALTPAVRHLARHGRVVKLAWRTRVGVPDAAWGALAAALAQMGQAGVALVASRARPASPLDIAVHADHRWLGLETVLRCSVRVSPLHLLVAGVLFLRGLARCSRRACPPAGRTGAEPRGRTEATQQRRAVA